MSSALDMRNNFNTVVNDMISREKLEYNCNALTILEFLRLRRRTVKSYYRL
jgi:hypothetical protein